MLITYRRLILYTVIVFAAGAAIGGLLQRGPVVHAQGGRRVFELRTYTAPEGKLDALNARFRNHTVTIFQRHGMKSVGYWVPQDAPRSQNTLVYVLEHPDREAAKKNWAAFQADPEWQKARAESEANGRIVERVESVFLDPTDYSPLK
jgi:NIPSNAP protein